MIGDCSVNELLELFQEVLLRSVLQVAKQLLNMRPRFLGVALEQCQRVGERLDDINAFGLFGVSRPVSVITCGKNALAVLFRPNLKR